MKWETCSYDDDDEDHDDEDHDHFSILWFIHH